jgi:hypothetical protein
MLPYKSILFQIYNFVIISDCLSHSAINFKVLLLEVSCYFSTQTSFCSCHTTSYQAARYVTATASAHTSGTPTEHKQCQ